METPWQNITRRIDIGPSTIDRTKDKERQKGRVIGRIPLTFSIERYLDPNLGTVNWVGFDKSLMMQLDVSLSSNFRITHYTITSADSLLNLRSTLCIRYREDEVVHRYRLFPLDPRTSTVCNDINAAAYDLAYNRMKQVVDADDYTGQAIKKNFVLEWYACDSSANNARTYAINFETTLNEIPPTPDDTSGNASISLVSVQRSDIDFLNNFTNPIVVPTLSQGDNN